MNSAAENDHPVQVAWVAFWELAARYFHYQVEGIEKLDQQPALIVGYHGRPLAFDLCVLSVKLKKRLGYLPHCLVHRTLKAVPGMSRGIQALGFVTHDDESIARAVAAGEHILIPPGGASEGMRSYHDNYRVKWPSSGYAKLAVHHRLPIVPVAAAGADDSFIGLLDGEEIALSLGLSRKWAWAPWTGIGPLGLYPFSPPFRARLLQVVGDPILTDHIEPGDEAAIAALHNDVSRTVQELLEFALEERERRQE